MGVSDQDENKVPSIEKPDRVLQSLNAMQRTHYDNVDKARQLNNVVR